MQLDENNNVIMITGRNAQGKSSILDSIWMALGGSKAMPERPIRAGEESGEIEVNLDGYIVTRTFTEKGSYLKVTNKEGAKYSNPQEFLNFIVGNLSFDPLEFARLPEKKQVEELMKISGVTFEDIDKTKKELLNERVIKHREINSLGAVISDEDYEKAKEKASQPLISSSDLNELYKTEFQKNMMFIEARKKAEDNNAEIAKLKELIEQTKLKISAIEVENMSLSSVTDTTVNLDELQAKIKSADSTNESIREAQRKVKEYEDKKTKELEYDTIQASIKSLDEERTKRLSEAKLPVPGLSWSEDVVLYNDIPYSQASSAEQLKISMAIAMAANPKLRVIIIKDGSLLDKENLAVIESMAKDNDFQIWLEAVDDSGKMGVYIEDGEIKTNNYDQNK